MKSMNKIILAVLLLASVAFVKAETTSTSLATGTNVLKQSQSIYLTSVQFANGTGSAVTVELFDAPTNVLTYSIGAYTNFVTYTSNVVSTVVGFSGSTNSYTNSTLITAANAVGSGTGNFRSVVKVTVPASSSLTVPINTVCAFGLTATNNGVLTTTLTYQKLFAQ